MKTKNLIRSLLFSAGILGLGLTGTVASANTTQANPQIVTHPAIATAPRKINKTYQNNNRTIRLGSYAKRRPQPKVTKKSTPNYHDVTRADRRAAPQNIQVHTSSSPYFNTYWTNRVNSFAKARARYYYPNITYNTRSLGALPTANYKYAINKGALYRTANLHYLDARGAKQLKRLRIHKDIDLRAWYGPNVSISSKPQPGEDKAMPDKYGIHMKYFTCPVENSGEEAITYPYRKKYGEAYRFNYWYALSANARRQYHNAFYILLKQRGPVMYNCTQGRDRTGTLSILIEKMLGVSDDNIYNDFLLTNHYKYQSSYMDQLARIDTFYQAIQNHYGSFYRYYRYGLNLPKNFGRQFRHKFLHRIYVHF